MNYVNNPDKLDSLPPQLREVVLNMNVVAKLLHDYETTEDSSLMKEAAGKIKSDAPVVKGLAQSDEFQVRQCFIFRDSNPICRTTKLKRIQLEVSWMI